MQHAITRDGERSQERHSRCLGSRGRGGETGFAQAGQARVVVVTGDIDERGEQRDRLVATTGSVERLGRPRTKRVVARRILELSKHRLDAVTHARTIKSQHAMTPEDRTPFAVQCEALCPGFRVVEPLRLARKSELLAGVVDGAPVLAKRLAKPNPVWAWYLAREIAIYRAFAEMPPPVRVPRLIAADDDTLVIERLPGGAIARRRRPAAELARDVVGQILATFDAFAHWTGRVPHEVPDRRVLAQLRGRFLEDPTAPIEWVTAGIARACTRNIFDADVRDRALAALAGAVAVPSHGDLLLRNAFLVDGRFALVDWECAGLHVATWDRALLWTQLGAASRRVVEESIADGSRRAFFALVVFALAREVAFLEAFRVERGDPRLNEVFAELHAAAAELA